MAGTNLELSAEICGAIQMVAESAKNNDIPKIMFTKAILDTAIIAIERGYEKEIMDEDKQG
ncbi:MAG: hypothetical protein KBT03_12070 [Bacteroidales bacterium]|nr:hypothetical protein [Candidatus Scybalousia scybalohippi]